MTYSRLATTWNQINLAFTTTLPLPAPPDDGAPFSPSEPSQHPLPTAPATPMMLIQSRLEWLLNNIHNNPIAPWMPDAVYRRYVLHLSSRICSLLTTPNATPAPLLFWKTYHTTTTIH